ncbi:MAG: glycosyltransferase family 39 protein [Bifidobacteriaceae bacterium]|jgi:hypothetical protein|nr:glycosyltransferase family 39 protein [Bifidobacteriaceae bacterium]
MVEAVIGRLTRRAVTLVSFVALVMIAAVALLGGSWSQFGWWWLAVTAAALAAVAVWRLVGGWALRAWRRLGAPKWVLPVALFAGFLAVKLVFAFCWQTQQRSDFLIMYQAAEAINQGDFSFNQSAYWQFFSYQTPFAIYEAFMLKLFGGALAPLLAVGALAMAGTNFLVYVFARRMSGSAVAGVFAGLMYLAYTGPYLLANVLTNDHLSTFFLYLGAYLVLLAPGRLPRPGGWALVAAGGVALQLGNLARPAGVVVCVGLMAALIAAPLMGLRRRDRTRPAAPPAGAPPTPALESAPGPTWRPLAFALAAGVAALTIYGLAGAAADSAVKASGVNPGGVGNHLPEWKLVMGLAGAAGAGEVGIHEATPKPDARATAQRIVDGALSNLPQHWPGVLSRQTRVLWAQNDTAVFQFWPQVQGIGLYEVPDSDRLTTAHYSVVLERGGFLPAVVAAAWGVLLINRRRQWGRLAAFLGLFIAAYALVHLAIEVQPRYRYLAMPAIFALGGPAWAWATRWRRSGS